MKTSTFLTLFLATLSLNSYAGLNHPADGKVKTNICDELVGDDQALIDACHAEHGKSSAFLKKQENLVKDLREKRIEDKRLADLAKNIETHEFDSAELLKKGFNRIFIAEKLTEKRPGVFGKPATITSGDNLCRYFGFQKAQKSVISGKHDNKTKAFVITEATFSDKLSVESYKLEDSETNNSNLYPFVSVTCVKSKIKENEVFDAIKEEVVRGEAVKVKAEDEKELTADEIVEEDMNKIVGIIDDRRSAKESRSPAVVAPSKSVDDLYENAFENRNKNR